MNFITVSRQDVIYKYSQIHILTYSKKKSLIILNVDLTTKLLNENVLEKWRKNTTLFERIQNSIEKSWKEAKSIPNIQIYDCSLS